MEAVGDCCGEWSVEFRTQYKPADSPECYALAVQAWNDAPRAASAGTVTLEFCKLTHVQPSELTGAFALIPIAPDD